MEKCLLRKTYYHSGGAAHWSLDVLEADYIISKIIEEPSWP